MEKIIIYDFDGTLTPYPVPKYAIYKECGLTEADMYEKGRECQRLAQEENVSLYTVYYRMFLSILADAGVKATNANLCLGSKEITYNKGVKEFLSFLKTNNVDNYIVSSGIKVYLDSTEVAKYFKKIYATTFNYDENNIAVSVDTLITDSKKIDIIKKIMQDNNMRDCSNIIYIGDGLTDYHAMNFIKNNGGTTILVYYDINSKDVAFMQEKNIVSHFFASDFSQDSELTKYIKNELNL